MLQLLGSPAHSEFRRLKLLAQCQERVPAVIGLYADFLHLAELIEPLSDVELRLFEQLLDSDGDGDVDLSDMMKKGGGLLGSILGR